MKNRILKLLCVFIVFSSSLQAQSSQNCVPIAGCIICDSVNEDNRNDVITEIMDYYETIYEFSTTVMSANQIEPKIENFIDGLFNSSEFSTECIQGNPVKLGYEMIAGEEITYDIFFRWDDYLPADHTYYSSYLDFTDAGIGDLSQESPRMIFNVPKTIEEKLYALNTRCDEGQSSYYIVIIDKDLALPAGTNSEMANGDESSISSEEVSLKTFPNPVSGETMRTDIYLPQEQKASISLVEGSTGKLLKTIVPQTVFPKGHTFQTIDLNGYASGVYYLILQTDEERITKKIIKI